MAAKEELDGSRSATDQTLDDIRIWPGIDNDGHLYKSRYLFRAVLNRHRVMVKVGNNFQDELQFYTNVIDVLFGWITREVELFGENDIWRWLVAYTYLMGSINYLGAEQALCSVFFSVICFSHRETFYYANYSFSGEATFRLYRQSYPEERGGHWRITSHQRFFPNLFACREEIFADMDYIGMSIDPSLCDYSRKNETKFHDTDILVLHENHRLKEEMLDRMSVQVDKTAFDFVLSGVVLGIIACYFSVLHVLRCTFVKCVQSRSARKWEPKDSVLEEDRMDSLTLETKMIKYEEYNCKPHNSHIKIKVATV